VIKSNSMRKIIYTTLFLFGVIAAQAQYEPQYSQFVFNKLAFNPAYAGSKEALVLGAVYRHQWEGVVGAPRTMAAYTHAPFAKNRGGVGLAITSDKIGFTDNSYVDLSYAYRLTFQNKSVLSVGLMSRFEYSQINWDQAQIVDIGDQEVPINESGRTTLNFGAGLYYTSKSFYVGFSMPQILKPNLYSAAFFGVGNYSRFRSYYFMTGAIAPVGDNVLFKPAMMISYSPNAPFEMDINASFIFMEAFWLGATYRLGDSMDGVIQYQFTKQFKAGVAMDFTLTELQQYSKGSFEILIEYLFSHDKGGVNNIRFF